MLQLKHQLYFRTISFAIVLGFILLMNADAKPNVKPIVPTSFGAALRSGDLVFRQGEGLVSEIVLNNRQGSVYSHVGMIIIQHQQLLVLHAAPAEEEHDFDGVKLEPLSLFTQSDRARHVIFMRPFKQVEAGRIAAKNAMKHLGKPFDGAFDLKSDDRIYCTELIAKAYKPLSINLYTKLRTAKLPFVKGQFLMPQDMYEQGKLEKIAAF
jgi:hypothetical protein